SQVLIYRNGKRIDAAGRDPVGDVAIDRGERHVLPLGDGGSARDLDGQGRRRFHAVGRQIVGGGESPAAFIEHAHTQAQRRGTGDLGGFSILGRNLAIL